MKNKNFSKKPSKSEQIGNQNWWESNPMTYDWEGDRKIQEGTKEWYLQLDEEFWRISKEFAHPDYPNCAPFSSLVNYNELKGKNVLEIGCGMGAHASVFANSGANVTAIDLTQKAIDTTNLRINLFNIANAKAIQADAENLPFPDEHFDFVWSWGVIHHSSNTDIIVKEIHRVLKPGGSAKIMIYNKNSTRYYIHGLYQGIFKLKFFKYPSLYAVNMTFTDGYIARHYTHKTAKQLFKHFEKCKTSVMDSGAPSVIFGWGRLSKWFPVIFSPINKFINRNWGWFLFIEVEK